MKKLASWLLVFAFVLTGFAFTASADEIKNFRDYTTTANEMETFCYQYSQAAKDLNVLSNVYDHLLTNDPNGGLQPALATEWYSNDGSVSWTFVVRDDSTWVDYQGNYKADVVPEDFATGLEWVLNAAKNQAANTSMPIQMIKGAEEYYNYTKELGDAAKDLKLDKFYEMVGCKVEGNTITFTCLDAMPWFPTLTCYNCLAPLSAKLIDEIGVDGYFGASYDTLWYNGPYYISDFIQGNEKTLTKNPSYYAIDTTKVFDTVNIKIVEDLTVAFTMFANGELDYVELTESEINTIYSNESNEWHDYLVPTRPTKYSYNWKWNFHKVWEDGTEDENWNKAVSNEAFRLSWYYGLDMTSYLSRINNLDPLSCQNLTYTMVNLVAKSDGTEFSELVLKNLGMEYDYSKYDRYDAEKAAAYKAQAIEELTAEGVVFPVEIDWYIAGDNAIAKDTADVLAQMFSDCLGDDYVKFVTKTYVKAIRSEITIPGYHSIASSGWGADYADPINFLGQEIIGDDNAFYSLQYNHTNEATGNAREMLEEFTRLVNEGGAITDDVDARYDALAKAEAFFIEHALVLPTYFNKTWQLTCVNDYSKIYSLYGVQSQRYVNWETNDQIYTADEYAAFIK